MDERQSAPVRRVGWVGAGRMGGPMALGLLRAGFEVRVCDSDPARRRALEEQGLVVAGSPGEVAAGADAVVLMLPSDDALRSVVDAEGLLGDLTPGQVLIDMGTSKLATSRRVAELASARGVPMLDAPVSGGEQGAREGTLSIMVGGDPLAFERCRPLFAALGRTITYLGVQGLGLVAKYVNQMLMEATFCAVAEAFALAAKAGADLERIYAAVRGGLGGSRVLDLALAQLLAGDLGSGRELTLHHKDGAYALAAAESLGVWAPVTQLSHTLFDEALRAGWGEQSAVAVARLFEQRAGVRLVQPGPRESAKG
ncbi:MAG TPA: NAD(P)-dependent oxidoreductase [Roseiflexaceae bacterium]|nr:NAD(P)-dependent oxidoreductase [Roseiflexaceae bacterium]